jgi:aspartyl-tRNA(Asn)/glutamyl-tRNA(Gln) amidotransferase subunit C
MSLTVDQVRWVAHLGRLDLSPQDVELMAKQLSSIVDYVALLQQVNTDGVEPLAHAVELQNVFRPDEPAPSLPVDQALANAPERQGEFYAVPAFLD